VSQKTIHLTSDHNFGKLRPIYKILSLQDCCENFVHINHKDSSPHLVTLNMFLHCLVKLENYICCRFQWHIACETSEFISFKSCDYKIWKKMQQCLQDDP